MLFVVDKSTIQLESKWEIINKDVIDCNKKITWFCPGGYTFKDTSDRDIIFDWSDYEGNIEGKYILCNSYSLQYDFISDHLIDNGYKDIAKDSYRLELFKDFKEFTEINCCIDIDEEEVPYEEYIKCVSFELYDPVSGETLKLI